MSVSVSEIKKPNYNNCNSVLLLIKILVGYSNFDNFNVLPHMSLFILKITDFFFPFSAQYTSLPILQEILVFDPLFKLTKPLPV